MGLHLINVTTNGMKGLEKPIHIDFYRKKTLNGFDPTGDRVRGIYGKNGAGKSAFVMSIWLATRLARERNFLAKCGGETMGKLLNQSTRSFSIELTFFTEGESKPCISKYGFSLRMEEGECRIKREWLDLLSGDHLSGPWKKVFAVDNGTLLECNVPFEPDLGKTVKESLANTLEDNLLLHMLLRLLEGSGRLRDLLELSRVNRHALSLRAAMELMFFDLAVYLEDDDRDVEWMREPKAKTDSPLSQDWEDIRPILFFKQKQRYAARVDKADWANYLSFAKKREEFIKLFKPGLKEISLAVTEDKDEYVVRNVFVYDDARVDHEFESAGIKKLMKAFVYLRLAALGKIVFIDELDTNVTGAYLREFVRFMNDFGEGQLCFTAHSLEPMYALSDKSKSLYFIGDGNEVVPWTKNAHYKPYILYSEGMIPGSEFPVGTPELLRVFS